VATAAKKPLQPDTYQPKELGPWDLEIAITHCGLCHTDVHLVDDDFGWGGFPLVPGHEIVGAVRAAGPAVSRFSIGQRVAAGWQRSSCMECEWCTRGLENCCPSQQATCVGHHGGFAEAIRIDSRFVCPLADGLPSAAAAPLLCAGITVYSPLRQDAQPRSRVGVIGVGGLGHLALRFARAFGCEVTAFSTTAAKQEEALRLGAHHFVNSRDPAQMAKCARSLDLLLDTVPAELDWAAWLSLLRPKGVLAVVGVPPGAVSVPAELLIVGQLSLRGSVIGSRSAIEEMLRFAALHGITAQAETMPMAEVNAALDRVRRNQARYRIVLEN
jgi:uncharacterized zinc-type alcohol dehydrogenase-like protein